MRTEEAIAFYKGVPGLAAALDIRRQAIYQWGEFPPRERQLELQDLTNGALVAEPRRSKQLKKAA